MTNTASETLTLRVTKVEQEAEDIRSFVLVDPDGGPLPEFTAGAHIDVFFAIRRGPAILLGQ